ncbi:biopolymer transporter ExbD [Pseudoalteromonas sp. MMG013]|uniref:biopolymer transporter ExbD n=1 Tax=Pseudoalteromonas sp. MMG013 TaxID=2822687 RepID=UPI001B35B6EB|nr:biopolymer transporter ExbD [Pseudoalteromonas sp. MMG013]MBQ4860550.1 biopolymer transporter ExbD [Pseudoalteromonas sp. MMG013]
MLELPKPSENALVPDLTALLDVLFIVLVFLLLSVAVQVNVMEVSLPDAGDNGSAVLEQTPVVLSLMYHDNHVSYALNDQPFSTQETLMQAVKHIEYVSPVFIAVDKHVPSEALVQLLANLSQENRSIANILIERK